MDQTELERYLDISVAQSVTIDVREVPEAPGHLRTITIHRDNHVTIEFQRCREYVEGDWEGGGLKYVGKYPTLQDAVRSLEDYLAVPLREWRNHTRETFEPTVLQEPNPDENLAYFEHLVRERYMTLPTGGGYQLAGIYWRHVQRYGHYRPDKLIEEQDLVLREQGIEPDD